MITHNIRALLNKRRDDHKQHCRDGTNATEQPEEARTVKLREETTRFDVILNHRNQDVAQSNTQQEASHDG